MTTNTTPSTASQAPAVRQKKDPIFFASIRNPAYMQWKNVRIRCRPGYKQPRYHRCSLHKDFVDFHVYIQWAAAQKGFQKTGFQIDKDLLIKGNTIYGPETCVFLPWEINQVLVKNNKRRGAYPIGVTRGKADGFYSACRIEKKQVRLGVFATPEEAFMAYKKAKEAEIKRLAQKWKDEIDARAYDAMMNYQVEITD